MRGVTALAERVRRTVDPATRRRREIAKRYLRGDGIEIGALHNPLDVPSYARVRYVDHLPVDELRRHYPELADVPLVDVDILDDGERLATIGDGTQDFVIANHFLEHCENPLGALGNMIRALRPGGVLYLAVPDKRYTFDADRPVTPTDHVLRDYREGPEESRRSHYEEWARFVDKAEEPEAHATALLDRGYSIHFHAWTQAELLELLRTAADELHLDFDIELMLKNRHEVIFVLRKN
ncbi:MAG TPA: methyltransferase domain-containing protein [Gaiellaceae bacterium]|jgi:SAM-dependent methyltransferase|nr:methyltransferase domain-containing protein [Gaiellaceae bacterium]